MAEWLQGRLGDFITLKRGYDLRTTDRNIAGSVPIVSSSGITGCHDVAKVNGPGVVTGRYGTIGIITYIEQPYWPLNTTLYVQDFKGNYPRFIYYFLHTLNFLKYGDKTSIPGVNRNDLHRIKVTVPPLGEQRKIARILGTWDEAIATTEQLIAALQRRKKGLMQRLLTGHTRLPHYMQSQQRQTTKFGDLPADWEYIPVGEVAWESKERNSNGDALTVLSCTKYDGLVDSLEYFGRQIFSEDTSAYKVVRRNHFAYATNHIEEGSIGYQDRYDAGLVSPMYTVFQTNERVNDRFLFRVLKTECYRHIFEVNTSGSINRRGSLRWNDFAQIKVPLPSLTEQEAIAEVLDTADKEIKALMQQRDALKQQKKGLMQRLLTGQVRVRPDDEDTEAA